MTDLTADQVDARGAPAPGRFARPSLAEAPYRDRGAGPEVDTGPPRDAERPERPIAGQTNWLQPFGPVILAVRWATTGVSVALASPDLLDLNLTTGAWLLAVLTNTVARTLRPLRYSGSTRSIASLFFEICLHLIAVIATGFWESPLVLLMVNAVIISGFARGFGFAIGVGGTSTVAVSLPELSLTGWSTDALAQCAQWTTLLLLAGIVAGYTRRISGEATLQHSQALDRVARLSDANSLLSNLHRVAQTLPASLDQADVLESTLSRLRALIDHDAALILTREDSDGRWSVAAHSAVARTGEVGLDTIPIPANRALTNNRIVRIENMGEADQPFSPRSQAGLYVPLTARGRLIGLLAIESSTAGAFSPRDAQLLRGFVEPVALAIDNARWFKRIRTVGADEERTRIARDIHDRIGQSLAYLGFEIESVLRHDAAGKPVADRLKRLRDDVRAVTVEVRDTLSDLRTDVTDHKDFVSTAEDFAARLGERSGLEINLDCEGERRLPILQEREMWRIAQEALVNVERHANASVVLVQWRVNEAGAFLEVADNGRGLPERSADGHLGRPDSYGIVGMRERADSVGATLELSSEPGEGTRIRCFLAQR